MNKEFYLEPKRLIFYFQHLRSIVTTEKLAVILTAILLYRTVSSLWLFLRFYLHLGAVQFHYDAFREDFDFVYPAC